MLSHSWWNEYSDLSSNPWGSCLHYTLRQYSCANTTPSYKKTERLIGIFDQSLATDLGDGNLWICTCQTNLKNYLVSHIACAEESGIYIYIYIYRVAHTDFPNSYSRYPSLSSIASGRSSRLHPVSVQSCGREVLTGHPTFTNPREGVYRKTSLMILSLLLQQCPTCLVRLIWIVFEMCSSWPYSCCFVGCCFQELFNIAHSKSGFLKLVDKFTYLGRNVSSTENDINTRLPKAWTAIDMSDLSGEKYILSCCRHRFP